MMTVTCKFCGAENGSDEFGLLDITGYDWNSNNDTALSISKIIGHRCANVSVCSRRIVDQANNLEGLRMVAADYENLGQLAIQARRILAEWEQMAQDAAKTSDLIARENGYGGLA